jgi:hypothetical protein
VVAAEIAIPATAGARDVRPLRCRLSANRHERIVAKCFPDRYKVRYEMHLATLASFSRSLSCPR